MAGIPDHRFPAISNNLTDEEAKTRIKCRLLHVDLQSSVNSTFGHGFLPSISPSASAEGPGLSCPKLGIPSV